MFFHANSRTPVPCLRMAPGVGGARQAHAGWPTEDDEYRLVANQKRRFERAHPKHAAGLLTYNPSDAVDLANGFTPNGVARQAPLSTCHPDAGTSCRTARC